MSRNFKLRQKKLKRRGYIIRELVETEEKLTASLAAVIKYVQEPCEKEGLLTKDEIHTVFSHLKNIMLFSKEISGRLRDRLVNFDPKNTKLLDIFLRYFEFFKIFSPYCNNFPDAQAFINRLRKESEHPFNLLLKQVEFTPELQGLSLMDHLIKPVQRLPKYELLLKDLQKNTEEQHPDFRNISEALESFLGLNWENNKQMETYLKQLRLFDLQKALIPEKVNLFAKHRIFIGEESLFLIKEECPIPATMYILNDLLVITENSDGVIKLLHQLPLDETSFMCDLENTRSYKWLFSVYGSTGGVILMTNSKTHKAEIMWMLGKTIEGLRDFHVIKQNTQSLLESRKTAIKLTLRLRTIGTVKRGIRGFKAYTLYVIEVKVLNLFFRLYIRFSELTAIESLVKLRFPEMKVPHFPKTFHNFFNSQQLKVIESRKLMIENFLQTVLQKSEIATMAKEILVMLGLPNDFYTRDLANETWELPANESGLFQQLRDLFYQDRILLKSKEPESKDSLFEVSVRLVDGSELKLKVSTQIRAIELCQQIAELAGLKSWLDFKLFLFSPVKHEGILIDDEEMVSKALEFQGEEQSAGVVEQILAGLKRVKKMILGREEVLMFRKQGFYGHEMESSEMERDPKRMDFIFLQAFQEVLEGKYHLSVMDYTFLGAVRLYTLFHEYSKEIRFGEELMKEILPNALVRAKDQNLMVENLVRIWKDFSEEISTISTGESRENQLNIARKLLLKFLERDPLFGGDIFWVQILHKEKSKDMKQEPEYVWLVVRFQGLALLHPSERRKTLKEIDMANVEEFNVYPNCVKIRTKEEKYRFGTQKGFEIGELLRKYSDFYEKKTRQSVLQKSVEKIGKAV